MGKGWKKLHATGVWPGQGQVTTGADGSAEPHTLPPFFTFWGVSTTWLELMKKGLTEEQSSTARQILTQDFVP